MLCYPISFSNVHCVYTYCVHRILYGFTSMVPLYNEKKNTLCLCVSHFFSSTVSVSVYTSVSFSFICIVQQEKKTISSVACCLLALTATALCSTFQWISKLAGALCCSTSYYTHRTYKSDTKQIRWISFPLCYT